MLGRRRKRNYQRREMNGKLYLELRAAWLGMVDTIVAEVCRLSPDLTNVPSPQSSVALVLRPSCVRYIRSILHVVPVREMVDHGDRLVRV